MDGLVTTFFILVGLIGAFGIFSMRRGQGSDTAGFLLGGRKLGPWLSALSASASAESGWVTLGLVGFGFSSGVSAFWIVPGTVLAFLVNWFFLAPRIQKISAEGALTLPDILVHNFPSTHIVKWVRFVGGLIIIVMLTAYVAAQFNAAGKTFTGSFGYKHEIGVMIGAGVVILYTLLGGFKSVVWTDVLQSILMIVALTIVPILLLNKIGGFHELTDKLNAMEGTEGYLDIFGERSGKELFVFMALWFGIPLGNFGQPHVIVRYMATKDQRSIRIAGIVSTSWVFILFTSAIFLGICARAWFGTLQDNEHVLPVLASSADLISPIVGGLILGAIFSAICSTTDSQLLVGASALSNDWLHKTIGLTLTPTRLVHLTRLFLTALSIVAAFYAMNQVESVFTFVLDYGWAGLGASFGPALIFRLFWKDVSPSGILAGLIAGVLSVVAWKNISVLNQLMYSMIPSIVISSLSIIIFSLMAKKFHDKGTKS